MPRCATAACCATAGRCAAAALPGASVHNAQDSSTPSPSTCPSHPRLRPSVTDAPHPESGLGRPKPSFAHRAQRRQVHMEAAVHLLESVVPPLCDVSGAAASDAQLREALGALLRQLMAMRLRNAMLVMLVRRGARAGLTDLQPGRPCAGQFGRVPAACRQCVGGPSTLDSSVGCQPPATSVWGGHPRCRSLSGVLVVLGWAGCRRGRCGALHSCWHVSGGRGGRATPLSNYRPETPGRSRPGGGAPVDGDEKTLVCLILR